jgi:hypothetical protein
MKWILSGIALMALLTSCDDSSTDGNGDTEEDSGASNPAADDDESGDEPMSDDDEADDEPMSDDDGAEDEPMAEDAGGTTAPMLPPPPEPISCGDVDCPAPPLGTPCCTRADDVEVQAALTRGACGVDLSSVFGGPSSCIEFDQPGELDDSCPSTEIPDAPPIPGCCTTHGFCGVADTFIGIGCTAPPPEFGEPIPCGDGGGDAGSSSSVGDGGMSAPGPDAGEMDPTDAGTISVAPDASAGDASL